MTKAERTKLRSVGQVAQDLGFVGKEGVTDNVLQQIDDNLVAHELVKIKVQKNAPEDINTIAEKIVCGTHSELVTIIGSKILIYRYSNKEKIKHIL